MTTGPLRLTRRCPVPGCTHRVGHNFMCRPCWHTVPEAQKAGVWAAVLAAVAAASEMQEART